MKDTEAHSRLHFIVKSFVMGQVAALLTIIIVFLIGKVDFIQLIIIGAFVYIISLAILRFGDSIIEYLTSKIMKFLENHPRTRNFLLKHF